MIDRRRGSVLVLLLLLALGAAVCHRMDSPDAPGADDAETANAVPAAPAASASGPVANRKLDDSAYRCLPLGPGEPIPPEAMWYADMVVAVREWHDRRIQRTLRELDEASKRLKVYFPLFRAECQYAGNLYTDALESLRERLGALQSERTSRLKALPKFAQGLFLLRLGTLTVLVGQEKQGLQDAEEGLEIFRGLYRANPAREVEGLIDAELEVARALLYLQNAAAAEQYLVKARELSRKHRKHIPKIQIERQELAFQQALTEVYQLQGRHRKAVETARATLVSPKETQLDPNTAFMRLIRGSILTSLGRSLAVLGHDIEAKPLLEEALTLLEPIVNAGHLGLGTTQRSLAELALYQGDTAKAEYYLDKARKTCDRCFPAKRYPNGHPLLLRVRVALAGLCHALDDSEQAIALTRENLKQCKRLYPKPHPLRLSALLAHAESLRLAKRPGAAEQARDLARQANALLAEIPLELLGSEDTRERWRVTCLLEQGLAHQELKQWKEVQTCLDKAKERAERLYPEEHPQRTRPMLWQAKLILVRRQSEKYEEAYGIFHRLLRLHERRLLEFEGQASAAEAMAFAQQRQECVAGLLSVCGHLPKRQAEVYPRIWANKQATMRLLQERRQAVRSARSTNAEVQKIGERLLDLRGQIAHELSEAHRSPQAAPGDKNREGTLARLYAEVDREESKRRRLLPDGQQQAELAESGPATLARLLPKGTAFVDLIRYEDVTDPKKRNRYVAFLLLPRQAPRWIDLDWADPIDEEVQRWRTAIVRVWPESQFDEREAPEREAGQHAAVLSQKVWKPLREQCPAARTIYFCLDGGLCGFPLVVLPTLAVGKTGRILLEEDLLIGYVPHGAALLRQLSAPSAGLQGLDSLLLLSNVDYGGLRADGSGWRKLTSGASVAERIRGLAGRRKVTLLAKKDAGGRRFREAIRQAQAAYLATHGYFLQIAWESDQKRWKASRGRWALQTQPVNEPLAMGRRSLLGYTGLVLSGANLPDNRDGLLTGEMIADLELEQLQLVMLSACDTGLGRSAIGEGVQGVQQAFHLAGCANVLASLWKCEMEPTDDLMAELCRQQWQYDKPPLLALRDAQRAIYLHPEREPIRAYLKGPTPRRTPVNLWAGLMLSGAGQ